MKTIDLSGDQQRAVERTGQDVCVVAGPGSGKTRVLTERFAWLVERQGVDPSRILAITFTEKAATEIKQRLVERFAHQPELRESIERAWVATIDGFATRLLRGHAISAGLAPDFNVIEQGAADRLLRQAAEEALDDLFRERTVAMRQLLEALDLSTQDDGPQPDLAASLIGVYETLRVSGARSIPEAALAANVLEWARGLASEILRDTTRANTPGQREASAFCREWATEFRELPPEPLSNAHFQLLDLSRLNLGRLVKSPMREAAGQLKNEVLPALEAAWLGQWYAPLHGLLREAVARIGTAYESAKRAESALDFADLVSGAVTLLEENPVVQRDVRARFDHVLMDELQDTNRLQWRLVDLVRSSFFGVGDVNQSIYAFRHAVPQVFEEYRRSLVQQGGVIDELRENYRSRAEILSAVATALDGAAGIEPRPLAAHRTFAAPQGPVVEGWIGQGDQAPDVEAALVAARIRELQSSGTPFEKIAVLVRTLPSVEPLARAFDRFGIPFLVSGGRTFLEARETRDILLLLAALANPLDEVALVGVLRGPLVGLSDEEIFRLDRGGRQQFFEQHFGAIRRQAGFIAPDRIVARILDDCGVTAALSERARANVEKLLAWLRREYRKGARAWSELVDHLESLRTTQSEAEAPPPEAAAAVRVMSIHAAKGLEFPVVFVCALQRGADRRKPVIAFSAERGLGAKWRHPVTKKGKSDAVHKALMEELTLRDQEEENRLLYVAMTRAEERLILSYAERAKASPWEKLVEAAVPNWTASSEAPAPPPVQQETARRREEGFVDAPEIPAQYDSSVSATDVARFESCPRQYYLSRYIGLEPEATAPGTGAIELGLEVHALLGGSQGQSTPEAAELARRFSQSEWGQRALRASRVEREFDFAMEIDDVIVTGQIDLWFEEGGELVLIDYKTDRDTSAQSSYTTQLKLYALALQHYAGRAPDRAVLYYLRPNQAVEVDLDLRQARIAVHALREAQESLEFPLNPGDRCVRCPHHHGPCPAP